MALEQKDDLPSAMAEEAPAISLAKNQRSYNGLAVRLGQIVEECNDDLRWPQCMETYKDMAKDATISSALNLMEMSIAKAEWSVRAPEGHEDDMEDKVKFLISVMHDMEHTWNDFIRASSTFNRYGFSPIEKVYRKRVRTNGSRHNDGLYGLRKLPLITQDSVASWKWSLDGRTLTGLKQWINKPAGEDVVHTFTMDKVNIPRKKFILFRADPQKDSPIGTSPLNSVYVAWRFKSELERHESVSIANDLRGLKVFKIPPRYMSPSATEEEKATYEVFKSMLRGMHVGEQSGVIIPQAHDENGKPLFDFEVKSIMGQATHDLNAVISRFRKEIVTGILNPQIILGQDGSGSFALADALGNVTNTVIDARLKEIRDQLNHDLIPQLFALNGWDTSVLPSFEYNLPDNTSIDDLGKFIQRVASVGMLKQDAETVNWIAAQAGMPTPFDDVDMDIEEVKKHLTGYDSNAGEGKGDDSGTGSSASGRDNSSANLNN